MVESIRYFFVNVWRKILWYLGYDTDEKVRFVLINQKTTGVSPHYSIHHFWGFEPSYEFLIDVSKVGGRDFVLIQGSTDGKSWTTLGDKFKTEEKRRYKGLWVKYIRAVKVGSKAQGIVTFYG
jgi:hypothetical protein